MIIKSIFENNSMIPAKYTCLGSDINPPLTFEAIPSQAKSLVLIVDDPDAPIGTWDHWILFNIPIINAIKEDSIPSGSVQGKNSWNRNDYGGPCPPSGTHRYFFKLYALDVMLDLDRNATKKDVLDAMKDHVLDQVQLIGLFKK